MSLEALTDVDMSDEQITRVRNGLMSRISSRRAEWRDEPTPRGRDDLLRQIRQDEANLNIVHVEGQIVTKLQTHVVRWQRDKQTTTGAIADLEQSLAAVPTQRGGLDGPRNAEVAAAIRAGLAFLRDGVGRGDSLPGSVIAWLNAHRNVECLMPLPRIAEHLARAQRELAPHRQRLDAALRAWEAAREPGVCLTV